MECCSLEKISSKSKDRSHPFELALRCFFGKPDAHILSMTETRETMKKSIYDREINFPIDASMDTSTIPPVAPVFSPATLNVTTVTGPQSK